MYVNILGFWMMYICVNFKEVCFVSFCFENSWNIIVLIIIEFEYILYVKVLKMWFIWFEYFLKGKKKLMV